MHHHSGISGKAAAAVGALVAAALPAAAQFTPHLTDYQMRLTPDDTVETGTFTPEGDLIWGERVNRAVMGLAGNTNFAGDPGFENTPGAFPVGLPLGLTIRKALREWDGLTFDGIAPQQMILVKFFNQVPTPLDDTPTPAFGFGAANSAGYFHHHVGFAFDSATPVEGAFLLELELWSGDASNVVSEPLFVVFGQGTDGINEMEAAEEWVRQNLLASPCIADLVEPFGVVDLGDVDAFINAFVSSDSAADLVEPFGVVDLQDVDAFISAFLAGCP
ncbi:MAG: GC-type dockerin domain-anchored protein [Planctomycetota bacterium]